MMSQKGRSTPVSTAPGNVMDEIMNVTLLLSSEETADLQRRASALVTDIKTFLLHVVHDTSHSLEPSAIDIPYEQWKQEFHSWVERGRRETPTRMTIKKVSTTDADSDERRVFSIWQLLVSSLGLKGNRRMQSSHTPKALQFKAPGCPRSELPGVSGPAAILPVTGCIILNERMKQPIPGGRILGSASFKVNAPTTNEKTAVALERPESSRFTLASSRFDTSKKTAFHRPRVGGSHD